MFDPHCTCNFFSISFELFVIVLRTRDCIEQSRLNLREHHHRCYHLKQRNARRNKEKIRSSGNRKEKVIDRGIKQIPVGVPSHAPRKQTAEDNEILQPVDRFVKRIRIEDSWSKKEIRQPVDDFVLRILKEGIKIKLEILQTIEFQGKILI